MSSYTDIFGGSLIQTADDSYLAINLNSNITLAWPTQFQNTLNVVSKIMDVTPDIGGRTLTLPNATQVSVGTDFLIVNLGAQPFNLLKNDAVLLSAVASGNAIYFYLTDNSTAAGVWHITPFGQGVATVLSVNGTVPNGTDAVNLTINGGQTSGPLSGVVALNFALGADLRALTSLGVNVGIAVRTAVNTWVTRSIVTPIAPLAGNLVITNPAGVAGNISIDLSTNIGTTGFNPIATMRVGNIGIGLTSGGAATNTISSMNANGNVTINPNGTGEVQIEKNVSLQNSSILKFYNTPANPTPASYLSLSGADLPNGSANIELRWPAAAPVGGQVLGYAGAGALNWLTPTTTSGATTDNHIARFDGAGGAIQDSTAVLSDAGALSGITTLVITDTFTTGALRLSPTNIISTTANQIILNPITHVETFKDFYIGDPTTPTSRTLYFVSSVNPRRASITASGAMTANLDLSLPPAPPTFNNQILQGSTTGAMTFSTLTAVAAVKADMETPASILIPVVPGVVQYHPGVVKAKANFTTAAPPVVSDAYNVANVVRTALGVYAVTFTTAFAAANYTVLTTIEGVGAFFTSYSARANNSFTINIYDITGAAADPTAASFAAFGTQ